MFPDRKPSICFIVTKGEITHGENGRILSPRLVAPDLQDMANVTEVDLTQGEFSRDRVVLAVRRNLLQCDGFVVAVGRHNLPQLAPYLAFALGSRLDRPVVLVGTNIVASALHSGAREQFVRATMAASIPLNQVAICFNDRLVGGTNFKVEKVGQSLIGFDSYNPGQLLGEFTGAGIENLHGRDVPQLSQVPLLNRFADGFLSIVPTTGIEDNLREWLSRMNPTGLVLTTDSRSVSESVIPMIDRFTERGIPTLIINSVPDFTPLGDRPEYETETAAENVGATLARGLGHDVAVVKFSWAVQKALDEMASGRLSLESKIARIRHLMQVPYVGEFGLHRPFTTPNL